MEQVVRLTRDWKPTSNIIHLDRGWYTTPTKLCSETGEIIEVSFPTQLRSGEYAYHVRKISSICNELFAGYPLYESILDSSIKEFIKTKSKENMLSGITLIRDLDEIYQDGIIKVEYIAEPELPYSEEDLVPSQFFGLDDYLKIK